MVTARHREETARATHTFAMVVCAVRTCRGFAVTGYVCIRSCEHAYVQQAVSDRGNRDSLALERFFPIFGREGVLVVCIRLSPNVALCSRSSSSR